MQYNNTYIINQSTATTTGARVKIKTRSNNRKHNHVQDLNTRGRIRRAYMRIETTRV